MKFHWTNRHTSYLCLGLLALIGGVLLYFKVRRFRHYIKEDIEQATPETPNNMEQPAVAYDTSVRGYRNNNPLNIRISSNNWKGEIKPSADGSFCQFTTMAYGFRAAMVCIRTYIRKYDLRTLQEIINRWAPWDDGNNPSRYAQKVIDTWPDVFPTKETTVDYTNKEQMCKLVYAMAIVENGSEPVMNDCTKAFDMI